VLFYVLLKKSYTLNGCGRLQTVKTAREIAYKRLERKVLGSPHTQGLIYALLQNLNASIAIDALAARRGGWTLRQRPPVTAVTPKDKVDAVKTALQRYEGEVLQARLNCEKAKVL
jgi:hypothetical protein